ncbi:hypothetical protein HC251_16670 [Iamia sp. SCSIO 61187]|uniref:hypothetical protein n=1 Tax=Iamia sp. SCSIO 61187 TaxID=2722752 RepID=UPI001C62A7B5|nr:hypothetical protein [Iamia sp. SCSIO 61187]QYG93902.1 hypothetical protein HC251_16670 [Iamia sp. SCSIO 61187]
MPPTRPPYRIVGYGAGAWNDWTRAPIDPISEDEARARHEADEPYGAVLTAAPDGRLELPVVGLTVNQHGITVEFHRHDTGTADLVHVWKQPAPGEAFRITQIDRRAGSSEAVPRDQLVYEYLKLGVDPAIWVHWTDAGAEVVEERSIDRTPFDLPPPAFGAYDAFLDDGLAARLWPGLPELAWIGPEVPVGP